MPDKFSNHAVGLESPATNLIDVIPSDTSDLVLTGRALNVAGAGQVRVTTSGGDTASIYVAAGVAFPIRITRVWETGTDATGIVVLY